MPRHSRNHDLKLRNVVVTTSEIDETISLSNRVANTRLCLELGAVGFRAIFVRIEAPEQSRIE